jgi:hypothetical protein
MHVFNSVNFTTTCITFDAVLASCHAFFIFFIFFFYFVGRFNEVAKKMLTELATVKAIQQQILLVLQEHVAPIGAAPSPSLPDSCPLSTWQEAVELDRYLGADQTARSSAVSVLYGFSETPVKKK